MKSVCSMVDYAKLNTDEMLDLIQKAIMKKNIARTNNIPIILSTVHCILWPFSFRNKQKTNQFIGTQNKVPIVSISMACIFVFRGFF